jgi:L-serine dehydratase
MNLSTFDLFKIGIGPSSSHTVGPMWAAVRLIRSLDATGDTPRVERVLTELFGSLALTGRGHCTDQAIILGLAGEQPDLIDADMVGAIVERVRTRGKIRFAGRREIPFHDESDLLFHHDKLLPFHPNGIRFTAYAGDGEVIRSDEYYSVGGGFVVHESETDTSNASIDRGAVKHEFETADDLLQIGDQTSLSIASILYENEQCWRPIAEIDAGLDRIWAIMSDCIDRGCRTEGILPGGLNVKRRAPALFRTLSTVSSGDPLAQLDWVSLFALAVNEENAAGGRVVTAPTNGAAGVIPAVLAYYVRFVPGASDKGIRTFLLTAAAIGMLYKTNASLSAAEMGCQGEVGVACSMAAAGLAAVMGGTNAQIENAAEIGMEHNLGLTCDPIKGLVQVPCIERNTMGAVKAINAARLAVLHGDGSHRVSLDRVIETMRQTGFDMQVKYKETSLGGLAVNFVEC